MVKQLVEDDLDMKDLNDAEAPVPEFLSFADLERKPRRSVVFDITTVDDLGKPRIGKMKFLALNPQEYDDLVAAHPPTEKEKRLGAIYAVDTFAPALIAAVSCQPRLSVEQATALYNSKQWSTGEISSLFMYAQRVCNSGTDIPFNDRG